MDIFVLYLWDCLFENVHFVLYCDVQLLKMTEYLHKYLLGCTKVGYFE